MKKQLLPFALLLHLAYAVSGQVWSPKAVGLLPANFNVADICIVNQQVIWAVAFNWQPLINEQPVPANAIPKMMKTTDGGETWTVKDIAAAKGRISYDIHAFDENTACITSQNFTNGGRGIFRTTDGGDTWTETFNSSAGGGAFHFFDNQEGVCVNYNGGKWIARTADGGATWALVSPANIPNLLTGEGSGFSSASSALGTFGNSVWFGTGKGRLLKSDDRGQTWSAHSTGLGSNSQLQSMGLRDEKNGLAVVWQPSASTYEIVRTSDGGLTWAKTGNFGFPEVDAVPCSNTFVAFEYWTGKRTAISTDLGQTWTAVDTTIDAAAGVFNSPEIGWMIEARKEGVGTGPALYKWVGAPLAGRTFVNKNASGANTGKTWADAFTDLQAALAAAQTGDEIWVAEGTYTPAAPGGSQNATFLINKNLKLYGGFAGTECYLSERDVALHPTVLSGDLNGDDVADDFSQNRTDNVRHVVQVNANITPETVFDGFTIWGGHANSYGGGIFSLGAPGINRCFFTQNFAALSGGGLCFNQNSSQGARVENCRFEKNRAIDWTGGAGMHVRSVQGTGVEVNHSTFDSNINLDGRGSALSGYAASLKVSACTFANNTNRTQGGALWFWATNFPNLSLVVDSCHFEGNESSFGGAMYFIVAASADGSSMKMTNSTFVNNFVSPKLPGWGQAGGGICVGVAANADNTSINIDGCHFEGNTSTQSAGAVDIWLEGNAVNYTLSNSKFFQNRATGMYGDGGGILTTLQGKNLNLNFKNCHFSENTAVDECGAADFWSTNGATGTLTVDSCLFEKDTAFWGGALEMGNGWGNAASAVNYQLKNSTFRDNHASELAGAALIWSDVQAKANYSIENCLVEGNTSGGKAGGFAFAPMSKDYHATVSRCRIVGNNSGGDGGAVHSGLILSVPLPTTASVLFENCLLAGNTGTGPAIAADSLSNLTFLNSTIANNSGGGIQLSDLSGLTLQNTILHNPGFAEYTAGTNDVTVTSLGGNLIGDNSLASAALSYDLPNANPLFAAPGDYRLAANSPAIDKGVDLGNLPATDLDGNSRVVGCPDIGAYESAVVVSTECVVGSGEAVSAGLLRLSPNPASDFLNIEFSEKLAVQVFDIAGKLVLEKHLAAGQRLDLAGLAPGVFLLKAAAGERMFSGKFIKQ